jgi:hypothetical protein
MTSKVNRNHKNKTKEDLKHRKKAKIKTNPK